MKLAIIKSVSRLLAVAVLAVGFWPSVSHAVQCTVIVANQPDPNITGVVSAANNANGFQTTDGCGLGDGSDNTAGFTSFLNSQFSTTLTLIDKTGDDTSGTNPLAITGVVNGTPSGSWAVDLDGLASFDKLFLIMKDGGTGDGEGPNQVKWVWFILDETPISCTSPADICGTWSMWGNKPDATVPKELSHFELLGSTAGGPGGSATTATGIPEPSTFMLVGAGLLIIGRHIRSKKE